MGNFISHKDKTLKMSNGLTDVFIATIGLSGSALAKADYEKNFIVWLLAKDQDFVGRGTVGFDLCEMPWSSNNFHNEKTFLLHAVSNVKNKIGWDSLPYSPNEELLFQCIDEFSSILEDFNIDDVVERYRLEWIENGNPAYRLGHSEWVDKNNSYEWIENKNSQEIKGYAKCSIHGLYLTYFGCFLCKNNLPHLWPADTCSEN